MILISNKDISVKAKLIIRVMAILLNACLFTDICDAQATLFGSQISLYVRTSGGDSLLQALKYPVQLQKKQYQVQKDERIELILAKARIFPNDKDIYSLLYELNPGIKDFKQLTPDLKIFIPEFKTATEKLQSGQLLLIHLDDSLKTSVNKQVKRLDSLASDLSSLQFLQKDSNTFKNTVAAFGIIAGAIAERTHPIAHDRLTDINEEAGLLSELINRRTPSPGGNLIVLDNINNDALEWAMLFSENKSPEAVPDNVNGSVHVTVHRGSLKQPLAGYRIYYCAPGLKGVLYHSISNTDPIPVEGTVSEGTWLFWAKKAGAKSGTPPDSETVKVPVRATKKNNIDLYILNGE